MLGNFHEAWCSLQNVAVSAGISVPYKETRGGTELCISNGVQLNRAKAQGKGFADRYGQSAAREDMGQFAAKAQWGAARSGAPRQCATLASGDVESEVLAYAKLRLLAEFGMISQERLRECLGSALSAPDLEGIEGIALGTEVFSYATVAGQALADDLFRATIISDSKEGNICNLSTPDHLRNGTFRIDVDENLSLSNRASLRIDKATNEIAYSDGLIVVDESGGDTFQGRVVLAGVATGKRTYDESTIVVLGKFKSTEFWSQ